MLYFARWKIALIGLICLAGVAFALPNAVGRATAEKHFPDWLQPVNLGLDLQGGAHFLLEVAVEEVIVERLDAIVDAVREIRREERLRFPSPERRGLEVRATIEEPAARRTVVEAIETLDPEATVEVSGNLVTVFYDDEAETEIARQVVNQSIEIVRRRVDELGTREPVIQRQGDRRILVQLPGLTDSEQAKSVLQKTARMTFHMVDHDTSLADAQRGRLPAGSMLAPVQGEPGRFEVLERRPALSGEHLVDAQPSFQQGQPVVSFRFDAVGGARFGSITQENVGNRFAILLDGEVISAPVIRSAILGGSGVIEGGFTVDSANELAILLRAGALPASLTFLEERTVGPGLGADSIRAGSFASVLGLVLVIVFMSATYLLFGVFAVITLLINLIMLLGALSGLGATLTLPGIAGIVLTMGMAVDANVLIFERIREEADRGRTPMNAAEIGFKQAFKTILDANITTLIAASLLFYFGSGPVKGFAVTLGIGILSSMFTAIMVTRMMVVFWLRARKPQAMPL